MVSMDLTDLQRASSRGVATPSSLRFSSVVLWDKHRKCCRKEGNIHCDPVFVIQENSCHCFFVMPALKAPLSTTNHGNRDSKGVTDLVIQQNHSSVEDLAITSRGSRPDERFAKPRQMHRHGVIRGLHQGRGRGGCMVGRAGRFPRGASIQVNWHLSSCCRKREVRNGWMTDLVSRNSAQTTLEFASTVPHSSTPSPSF